MSADIDFRRTLAFDASTDIGPQPPPQLVDLIAKHPELKIFTLTSPYYQDLKAIWSLEFNTNEPLAVIRVTNASEVSTVIKFCVDNSLPLTVRSGGHDLLGHSLITGAVIVDIRELNQITLSDDKKSITIGGGTQTGDVVDFLDAHGLVTPCPLASVTGHVGWAFSGGFGPFVNAFGLGVDQIISAKVVTADGELREAEGELLWGIKGAGGAFGVLTEVKFKVYSLSKMLGGMLMFEFDEGEKVVAGAQTLLDGDNIPSQLSIGFHFTKRGGVQTLMVLFSWASTDFEEGRKWLDKVKGLGTVMKDMVSETTIKKWCDMMRPMLPLASYNSSRSFFISELSTSALQILVAAVTKVPQGMDWGIGLFLVRGEGIKPQPSSSFILREKYVFLHALGPVKEKERLAESKEWTNEIMNEMKKEGLVKANYLAFSGPDISSKDCFGEEKFERLKALKKKVDPGNVFKNVPAQLA
ncbi:FAD-binding domain-containing protein [Hyaloscypha variabilis F]|uniref:FAD-binding domain-containing protein n=1 Tax=Hyaloscypha variabilis (strain UAMH 11265 / GT02V1 / F) TaxID=1149755 RepID=A0A2J6SAF2_HYAVF|nr:FAD-binding domain-containing protein [Hyaloscypha variabilis F]